MKEAKSYRSVYDIKTSSAWQGPYRRPTSGLTNLVDWLILAMFIIFIILIGLGVFE